MYIPLKETALQRLASSITTPIFVLSAPRSGSSFLYEILRHLKHIWSLPFENDGLWRKHFPYGRNLDGSEGFDFIDASELRNLDISLFKRDLIAAFIRMRRRHCLQDGIRHLVFNTPIRFVDKTTANCFHLDALEVLHPDAYYIHLVRDGRSCVSSMLEGWNSGFFEERKLPFPQGSTISHWTYSIPPNWQCIAHKPLEEICAWSWIQHNRHILDRHRDKESFRTRYMRLTYEELVADPHEALARIATFTGATVTEACLKHIDHNPTSRTTLSPPKADKWKLKNAAVVDRIVPHIQPLMEEIGYRL